MIYEERRIRLTPGCFRDYRTWVLERLWPRLAESGHRPLCLLNGLIGAAAEDVVLIVGFEDFDAWQAAQPALVGDVRDGPRRWIESEEARPLLASAYRPDGPTQPEDRRPVYGLRRWWIQTGRLVDLQPAVLRGRLAGARPYGTLRAGAVSRCRDDFAALPS